MEQLEGRVAVITGAGSGIGEALARSAAQAGMRVIASDIEASQVDRVAASIEETGGECIPVHTDVADMESVESLAAEAYDRFGAVHLLCNNAGVLIYESVDRASRDDWDWLLSVNLYGVIHGIQAFVPRMRSQDDEAHIVNTGSMSGLVPYPDPADINVGPYIASKYAVVGLSEVLRGELAPEGIGVSVLCPSGVVTRIGEATRNRPERFGGPSPGGRPPSVQATDDRGTRVRTRRANLLSREPVEVAALVLDGIRANRLYIHTDGGVRTLIEERFQQILEAFDHVQ